MIRLYFKTAIRNFRKNKLFTFINLFGLSVGITAAILILVWVQNERSFDTYHNKSAQIYRTTFTLTKAKWVWANSPFQLAETMQQKIPEVEAATKIYPMFGTLSLNVNNRFFVEKKSAYVDSAWFDVFKYEFLEGNPAAFNANPFSMILTKSKAEQLFGKGIAVGRSVSIDTVTYQVQGVIADNPANSSFQYDIMMPLASFLSNPITRQNELTWNNFNYLTFVRLKNFTNPTVVGTKITRIVSGIRKDKGNDFFTLTPLHDMHFETGLTSSSVPTMDKKVVNLFSMLAILLLIIACINYVNLTTGKASLRAKEVSIKKIVGARRSALFLQFIMDSLVMTVFALILSVIFIYLLLPFFSQLSGRNFKNVFSSSAVWSLLLLTIPVMIVLNGIYPAILLSSFKPLNVLKGVTILKIKDASLRKVLVVVQFTLSLTLIIAAIVVFKQLKYIQTKDIGYDRSQVFTFRIPYKNFRNMPNDKVLGTLQNIKSEMAQETSVAGVTIANQSIVDLTSSNSGSADWDGHDTTYVPTVFQLSADADYADVMGLEVKEGRWFDRERINDKHNFLLNETAVKEFNIHKPVLGQRFIFQGDTGQITGVIKDFNFKSVHEKIQPLVVMNRPGWSYDFFVKTMPGKNAEVLDKVRKIWDRYTRNDGFEYTFLDDRFDKLYKSDKTISLIILVFAIVAIVISALGLLGLASFAIDRRTKEIGIRKVLGATVLGILTLLSKDFVKLVFIAILIAFPLGWWAMSKWLEDFAYRINIGWFVFVLSGIIALAVVCITVSLQSLKAASANPVHSLRNE
jgi:putative ABC transport system permease protein